MNKQAKILAVIVTYNPEIGHLKSFLEELSKQIDLVLIYDNNSLNFKDIASIQFSQNVIIHSSPINKGLPTHYNAAIQYGLENGFDNLLILDQDSTFDKHFLDEYRKHLDEDFFCLVPFLVHNNNDYEEKYPTKTKNTCDYVKRSINSGTLIYLHKLPNDIRFDEDLFIDCVDFDFFIQANKFRLKTLRINSAKLHISLGNISRIGPFFLYNYSPFRLEKQTRDRVIFLRKHPISAFSLWLFLFTIFCDTKAILFERERLRKIKAIVKGFKEGLFFRTSSRQHP
ncbi:glycosyltransferase [uncultured Fibrobacter sp.]|uniref:glycosyltransferase n=1 Tax=uncultured Fibrobacter sp. TaxID=261512 RepID=UPI002604D077|nr:glycosyltransferase [uncultured Fibrobacter sp.]